MNAMSYKGYSARIDYDEEDEIFVGRLIGITDVVGFHADTVTDLKAAFAEAVDDYLETCRKVGKDPQKPYSGKLMFRVRPDIHAGVARAASLEGKSINQWAEEVLEDAVRKRAS